MYLWFMDILMKTFKQFLKEDVSDLIVARADYTDIYENPTPEQVVEIIKIQQSNKNLRFGMDKEYNTYVWNPYHLIHHDASKSLKKPFVVQLTLVFNKDFNSARTLHRMTKSNPEKTPYELISDDAKTINTLSFDERAKRRVLKTFSKFNVSFLTDFDGNTIKLQERWLTSIKLNSGTLEIFEDPSKDELLSILRHSRWTSRTEKMIRLGVMQDDLTYAWDGNEMLHYQMEKELKVKFRYNLILYYDTTTMAYRLALSPESKESPKNNKPLLSKLKSIFAPFEIKSIYLYVEAEDEYANEVIQL